MDITKIMRKRALTEEIDYPFVMSCLSNYKNPRSKLTKLLKNKELVRVKKGLYIFGEDLRKRPYSLEVLANLIYGPSYISYEYALSYHNLIPEAVTKVTSATSKRIKNFKTTVGEFSYQYIPPTVFHAGIKWEEIDEWTHFFLATKEKALADFIAKLKPFQNKEDLLEYLIEGMRIDREDLFQFNLQLTQEIANLYQNKNVTLLWKILKK